MVLPEVGAWRKTGGILTGLGGWLLRILAAVPWADEDWGRGREGRLVKLVKAGSRGWIRERIGFEAENVLVVVGAREDVLARDSVDGAWRDGTEGKGKEELGGAEGESSRISKIELSKDEAFLFILVTILGRTGVPLQLCCLWQVVWNVSLHTKHFTGFAGFLRGLLQKLQVGSEIGFVGELSKLFSRTARLNAEMSWPRALPSLRKSPMRRFLTNQVAATEPSWRMAPPCT